MKAAGAVGSVVLASLIAMAQAPGAAQSASRDDNWKTCRDADPDVAIPGCRALIESRPDVPGELADAHRTRGNAYRSKGFFDLAFADYDDAIAADPGLAITYGDRGMLLTARGRHTEAIPDLTRAIEANPRDADSYYYRGLCYEALGIDDLAIEDISASIGIKTPSEFLFERRGTIYFRKGDYDRALDDYEHALAANPQYAPAMYARGVIKLKKGDAAGGKADIALATKYLKTVALEMARAGVKP
jgi:tetratricopeptide (TPR) repeat protein